MKNLIVELFDTPINLAKKHAGGKKINLWFANTCRRFMDPYVPADNLILAQNVDIDADENSGYITYKSPYAHYQWEGELYGPSFPVMEGGEVVGFWSPPIKYPTGDKLHYSTYRHPLATDHWDKAMLAARKGDLIESVERYLNNEQT